MTESNPGDGTVAWRRLWADTATALGDRTQARWMCEVASGCDGAEFVAELDQPAANAMVAHLDAMIARRLAGEPLQYVLGRWQFRTLDLMIDRRVLIPRPETEWVCETALAAARAMARSSLTIVDLGTGSGAIGLSMAAELAPGSASVWLTDISADALDVASANLAGIAGSAASVRVVKGSWFEALPEELRGIIDVIVANPPYIAVGDPDVEADVTSWEPHLALFAGGDGLGDIRVIVAGTVDWLRRGGAVVLEIGSDQGDATRSLLRAAGLAEVEIRQDLTGRDRIAIARRA